VQEAVSDILQERARETESIGRMVGVSLAAHVVLMALIVFLPSGWLAPARPAEENALMISLGGVEGPNVQGMTQISGRTAQAVREPDAPARPEPPPAADTSKMIAPTNVKPVPPKPPPSKPVTKPAERSTSKTPTTGKEVATGASKVDTGARPVPFGGLASQAGGGFGGARTDYANFCCPEYLNTMVDRIRGNWQRQQGATGVAHMRFVVQRDGSITGIEVEKSSGQALLDQASTRALTLTRLPPLPREFTGKQLTVYLPFEYQR
jgi:periplasmic protein TonB